MYVGDYIVMCSRYPDAATAPCRNERFLRLLQIAVLGLDFDRIGNARAAYEEIRYAQAGVLRVGDRASKLRIPAFDIAMVGVRFAVALLHYSPAGSGASPHPHVEQWGGSRSCAGFGASLSAQGAHR